MTLKPLKHQIDDTIELCRERVKKNERVLVTTLTKRTAERSGGLPLFELRMGSALLRMGPASTRAHPFFSGLDRRIHLPNRCPLRVVTGSNRDRVEIIGLV